MADETPTFEELKAEQDRLWAEIDAQPTPPGYDDWVREQVEVALRELDEPGAKRYTVEEVREAISQARAASKHLYEKAS